MFYEIFNQICVGLLICIASRNIIQLEHRHEKGLIQHYLLGYCLLPNILHILTSLLETLVSKVHFGREVQNAAVKALSVQILLFTRIVWIQITRVSLDW